MQEFKFELMLSFKYSKTSLLETWKFENYKIMKITTVFLLQMLEAALE